MGGKKLTRRWLFNSFGSILIVIIVLVAGVAVAIHSYYYNSAKQYILSRAESVTTVLDNYAADSGVDFSAQLRKVVENFEYKDKMEMMCLDASGAVSLTSSGFEPEGTLSMPDYALAKSSSDGTGEYIGKLNGEKIMAVTVVTDIIGEDFSAMRYLVSLDAVDEQVTFIILMAVLLGMAILLFVIYSSSYFINSIVLPVSEVSRTTEQIAQGDFDVRLTPRTDDEIGQLCGAINNMAEELSKAEQIKNDFISSVSHELRTPLTAIRGWAETLQADDGLDPETRRKGLQVIMSETERLSSMVEELLDFSRLQGGRMKLEPELLDAVAELSDAVLMFTERAKNEKKQLLYTEPEAIAPVMGDRNRLRQVFVNILDNALKYSDAGDSVTVTAEVGKESIEVTVRDTGIGISGDDLSHVKDKFYKGKTNRRGSGIGLAVADEIIKMHGGSLSIASEKGVGTAVTITLPLEGKSGRQEGKE